MHLYATRDARRSPLPALIFNQHSLFMGLRQEGRFAHYQRKIRLRDITATGSNNPLLGNFGESTSDVRQFTDSKKSRSWKCPLIPPKRHT